MNMIEKVAKALYDVAPMINGDKIIEWDGILPLNLRNMTYDYAKAAIQAMREPSEEMLEPIVALELYAGSSFNYDEAKEEIWYKSIDAALKE